MHMFCAALPSPQGPITTVGLTGFRDGTVDYRILCQLDRLMVDDPRHESVPEIAGWLQKFRDKVPMPLVVEGRDVADTADPPVDCVAIRRQALDYIAKLKGSCA